MHKTCVEGVKENNYEIHLNELEILYQRMCDILHGMLTNPATGIQQQTGSQNGLVLFSSLDSGYAETAECHSTFFWP